MPNYRVYVIELNRRIFNENSRFRKANPQFNPVLDCLYVGMTSKTPKERFDQHIQGYINERGHKLAANMVQKYGTFLRPTLYSHLKPVKSKKEALALEKKLTLELRRQRYAVWSN